MKTCYTNPPLSSDSVDSVTFRPGSAFWATVPPDQRDELIRHHMQRALRLATDSHLPLPVSWKRFELIVLLAVEAETLFFNAAVYEPSSNDRDMFFAEFLRRALHSASTEIQ